MPDALTPARLRELIAAATPGPWTMECEARVAALGESIDLRLSILELNQTHQLTREQLDHWDLQIPNLRLLEALVNHAPALADDMEKARLLEWAIANCYIAGPTAWEDGKQIDAAEIDSIDALRAAKEAADAKA